MSECKVDNNGRDIGKEVLGTAAEWGKAADNMSWPLVRDYCLDDDAHVAIAKMFEDYFVSDDEKIELSKYNISQNDIQTIAGQDGYALLDSKLGSLIRGLGALSSCNLMLFAKWWDRADIVTCPDEFEKYTRWQARPYISSQRLRDVRPSNKCVELRRCQKEVSSVDVMSARILGLNQILDKGDWEEKGFAKLGFSVLAPKFDDKMLTEEFTILREFLAAGSDATQKAAFDSYEVLTQGLKGKILADECANLRKLMMDGNYWAFAAYYKLLPRLDYEYLETECVGIRDIIENGKRCRWSCDDRLFHLIVPKMKKADIEREAPALRQLIEKEDPPSAYYQGMDAYGEIAPHIEDQTEIAMGLKAIRERCDEKNHYMSPAYGVLAKKLTNPEIIERENEAMLGLLEDNENWEHVLIYSYDNLAIKLNETQAKKSLLRIKSIVENHIKNIIKKDPGNSENRLFICSIHFNYIFAELASKLSETDRLKESAELEKGLSSKFALHRSWSLMTISQLAKYLPKDDVVRLSAVYRNHLETLFKDHSSHEYEITLGLNNWSFMTEYLEAGDEIDKGSKLMRENRFYFPFEIIQKIAPKLGKEEASGKNGWISILNELLWQERDAEMAERIKKIITTLKERG